MMRIHYFGVPLGALALHHHGFSLSTVVIRPRDTPGLWRLRRALPPRTLLLVEPDLSNDEVQRVILSSGGELTLSWFYPRKIPSAYLQSPRGAWGFHPSLLPRWRGPDPYFWAIRAGDPDTGVTVHQLMPEYDEGPIARVERVPICADDNAVRLSRKLDRLALTMLVEFAQHVRQAGTVDAAPQRADGATAAPFPTDEQRTVRWDSDAEDVARLVRAASPWPGASAQLGAHQVDVLQAEVATSPLVLGALVPSEAVCVPEGIVVKAADRGVLIRRVRLARGRHVCGDRLHTLLTHARDDASLGTRCS
jgi:methionyl-tRNA formyltransferase